jgi:hypothetical protein
MDRDQVTEILVRMQRKYDGEIEEIMEQFDVSVTAYV